MIDDLSPWAFDEKIPKFICSVCAVKVISE